MIPYSGRAGIAALASKPTYRVPCHSVLQVLELGP